MEIEPDRTGSEIELLGQYLDVQRAAVLERTKGLDRDQLTRAHPPSALTLGGLLHHLALAEQDWMEIHFLGQPDPEPFAGADWSGDPDWQFRVPEAMDAEELRERYREACARSRSVVERATDLEQLS